MGFLSGRATFERMRVIGHGPRQFSDEYVATLADYAIGNYELEGDEDIEVGLTGGEHILDTEFSLEKNIINDCLHFALRVDSCKPPSALVKAYTAMELAALVGEHPSGYPSREQVQEAREAALARCENEVREGKYRRIQQFEVLWDCQESVLYFGSSSETARNRLAGLFDEAFGLELSPLTAGRLAEEYLHQTKKEYSLDDVMPSDFAQGTYAEGILWCGPDAPSPDFLGNEFLLWLWYQLQSGKSTIEVADGSKVDISLTKTLLLECPRGELGKQTLTANDPIYLPEAKQGIRSGKLPRKAGLLLARHEEDYEFTLSAEALTVGSVGFPRLEVDTPRAEQEERMDQLRHFNQTFDVLYQAFLAERLDDSWEKQLPEIQIWLQKKQNPRRRPAA